MEQTAGDGRRGEPAVFILTEYAQESPTGRALLAHAAQTYPGRRVIYGLPWGMPPVPAPAPEQNAEPKNAARVRYVVQNVDPSTPLSSPQETVWRVQVRQDQNTSGRTFVLYVAQRPEAPAPYDVGATCELDPRLVEQE